MAAAAELFAEQGFRRTTVAEIADRAEISRGSIPWHFGNKEGLLEAVAADFSANWFGAEQPAGGALASLDQFREFLRQPTTRLLITLVAEAVEPGSPVHDFYAEFHRLMRVAVARVTEDVAMPPGVSHEEFTTVLSAAIMGVHQQWRVAPDEVDLDRTFDALKTIFLSPEGRRTRRR